MFVGPPVFILLPVLVGEVAVAAGGMVTLYCEVTGNPRPELEWTVDGRPILASEPLQVVVTSSPDAYSVQSNLTIGPMEPELAGDYECIATGFMVNRSEITLNSNTTQLQFTCKLLLMM